MPENLYQRGNTWWGRVQIDGLEHRKSLRTTSKVEAKKRRKKWLEQLTEAAVLGIERHSWKEAVVVWAAEYLPDAVKPKTSERYLVSVRQHDAALGNLFIHEINIRTIAGLISDAKRRKVTNRTIKNDLTAISSVLRFCVAQGWRDDNPAKAYDRSIVQVKKQPIELPERDDIDTIIAACPGNFAGLVALALHTGMREEEIASLEHSAVSVGRKQITLTKTKTSRPRTIPLYDDALGTIVGTVHAFKSPYVFWHDDGERYANVSSRFGQIRLRVNQARAKRKLPKITFRFHDLRHRYAVDYLRGGGNIYNLQQILGHSSIRTTELYLDYLEPEEQLKAKYESAQNPAQV